MPNSAWRTKAPSLFWKIFRPIIQFYITKRRSRMILWLWPIMICIVVSGIKRFVSFFFKSLCTASSQLHKTISSLRNKESLSEEVKQKYVTITKMLLYIYVTSGITIEEMLAAKQEQMLPKKVRIIIIYKTKYPSVCWKMFTKVTGLYISPIIQLWIAMLSNYSENLQLL